MNFYFSLNHLNEVMKHSKGLVEKMAGQSIRTSPRKGQANRGVLNQCNHLLSEADGLIKRKISLEKTALRRPTILFRALEIAFQRVLNLAGATAEIDGRNKEEFETAWKFLYVAQRHYRILKGLMDDLTGVPVKLEVSAGGEDRDHGFIAILQREAAFEQETLKLIEKATQVFGEKEEVMAKLFVVRKDLLDSRRALLNILSRHSEEKLKQETGVPAGS